MGRPCYPNLQHQKNVVSEAVSEKKFDPNAAVPLFVRERIEENEEDAVFEKRRLVPKKSKK